MRVKTLNSRYFNVAIAAFAIAGAAGLQAAPVHAAGTYVWTGTAGDNLFSTAANWQGSIVPTDDSALVFECTTTGIQTATLVNDLAGVAFNEISTPTGVAGCGSTSYSIDTIAFTPTAATTGSLTNSAYVRVVSFTGLSALSHTSSNVRLNTGTSNPTQVINTLNVVNDQCGSYSLGKIASTTLNIGAGSSLPPYTETTAVTVAAGGMLGVGGLGADVSYGSDITFAPGSGIGYANVCMGSPLAESVTVTLSGDVVLNGDVPYELGSHVTLRVTGNLSGSGKFVAATGNQGVLDIAAASNTSGSPNGVVDGGAAAGTEVALDGDQPTQEASVIRNIIATLNGTRGTVTVDEGGVLKGTGTANYLLVAGVVAPGNSPGTITVVDTFTLSGTGVYSAEILSSTTYDQIIAGNVNLNAGSALQLTLVPGAVINKDNTFTIINNTGSSPVMGTFAGLAEGAQIVVGGATFSISYVGGTGNDVVLTALNDTVIPGVPNTGVAQLMSNPLGIVASAVGTLGVLIYMFKRK